MTTSTRVTLPVRKSGWYLLRVRGDRPAYPILDVFPYATTSPIYVIVDNHAIRSRADAEYFIAWIDRLETGVLGHKDWNSDEERARTLDIIWRAREEFKRRLAS